MSRPADQTRVSSTYDFRVSRTIETSKRVVITDNGESLGCVVEYHLKHMAHYNRCSQQRRS